MTRVEGYHLPGLTRADLPEFDELTFGDVTVRIPELQPEQVRATVAALRTARAELFELPAREIATRVARAADQLQQQPLRKHLAHAVAATSGYSDAMADLIVQRMCADWSEHALHALLESELGDAELIDRFIESNGVRTRAFGPALTFHIFAGNVPGVSVTSLVRALLVKSCSFGKMGAGDIVLAPLFARMLSDLDPLLGRCIAVTYWKGGEERALEDDLIAAAETIVLYGGADVERAVRARTPSEKRLVVHGARVSFGIVARSALSQTSAAATASEAALAAAVFDQHGCVSPHTIYVEQGGDVDAATFAGLLAAELDSLETILPRGTLSLEEAAAVHSVRSAAEFRSLAGGSVEVHGTEASTYAVILDADPAFSASCLNRTVFVKPVADVLDVPTLVAPHAHLLQTAGVAGIPADHPLHAALARAGVSRITSFPDMPWPPGTWHHDGHSPLRELVRFVDLELG